MIQRSHLTDQQMYELLEPASNGDAIQHLHSCSICQSELTHLRASLATFRGTATNFAAAAAPMRAPIAARVAKKLFGPRAWAASFATATALLAVSISVLHPGHNTAGINTATTIDAAQAAPPAESDDELLDCIQSDLSTSIPPSLEPLAVPTASSETSTQN
jgi:anti-sigma factor RsiW